MPATQAADPGAALCPSARCKEDAVLLGVVWCFAQRRHWAWIALTILSFNPIAWIINAIYLRKRWAEDAA